MRFISGTIMGIVLAASITCVSSTGAHADEVVAPQAGSVDVSTATIPAALAAGTDGDLVAELPARRTDDFGLVGVTWDRGFDPVGLLVEVRLRADGAWGDWQELHVESDSGDEGGRDGTEPLWAGSADGVSVRVTSPTGERPAGLEVSTIDPGAAAPVAPASASVASATSALYTRAASAVTTAAASPDQAPQPAIIPRAAWGAAPNTKCDTPIYGTTRGAVVHHTAGTNTYTAAESAAIVRATQAYHMKSRNWCDIGYNFLVDRYGQIFEGRNGGIDKQVRAAHSGNAAVNQDAMGVSMMGTFATTQPTDATKDAVVRLIAWRFAATATPALGTYSIGGKTLNRIAGHRDVVGTECPGAAAYAWLSAPGGLRERVANYAVAAPSKIAQQAAKLGAAATGKLIAAEYPFSVAPGGFKARYQKVDIISSKMGTFAIGDVVRTRYNALSAQSGVLGVPTGSRHRTKYSNLMLQRFHHGTIYRVKKKGKVKAFAVYGRLENRYIGLKEAKGKLGFPTKTQTKLSGGRERAYFTKGTLTLESNGRITVSLK